MSSFIYAPLQGHMDLVNSIYVYLDKISNACIQVQTEYPDYYALPYQKFYWEYSLHVKLKELLPDDTLTNMVNYVSLTHYVDYDLFHDQLTGHSITGILHLVNKTPVHLVF